jgi:hypothetical protein
MPRLHCANAPATASLFVQLSMRRQAVSGGLPILDLLLPLPSRLIRAPSVRAYRNLSTRRIGGAHCHHGPSPGAPSSRPWGSATLRGALPKPRATPLNPTPRAFGTSSPWRATHAIFNPQVDDDGKDMVLEITQRAAKVRLPLHPDSLSSPLSCLTNPPPSAPLRDHGQRLEPEPRPPNPS